MKTLLITLTIASSAAFAAQPTTLAFTEMLLKKDLKSDIGVYYVVNRSVELWCMNRGSALSVSDFEVARELDNLSDGFYRCTGKFVQIPGAFNNPIQIIQIDNCAAANSVSMKESCPVIK